MDTGQHGVSGVTVRLHAVQERRRVKERVTNQHPLLVEKVAAARQIQVLHVQPQFRVRLMASGQHGVTGVSVQSRVATGQKFAIELVLIQRPLVVDKAAVAHHLKQSIVLLVFHVQLTATGVTGRPGDLVR